MLHIRRYQPADHGVVWELHHTALYAANAHAASGPWDDDLHQIEAVYLDNGGEFLVGIYDREIVAMGALKRVSADRAEIKRMRVNPAFWRHGFGQAMLTALERRAVELGVTGLHLDTTLQQEAAQRLYIKNGFRQVRRAKIDHFDIIFYEKSLVEIPPA